MTGMTAHRYGRRHAASGTDPRNHHWPLLLIAAPAAVAIWSGWVGLGSMCGFGIVHPLPGILNSAQIDTAITLPIGVESYGAYALWIWLSGGGSSETRRFARNSAFGALALGCLGQVAFHLLAAAQWTEAPPPVVVVVACIPVVTLALAAALIHMTRADRRADEDAESEKAAAEEAEQSALRAALEAESAARSAAEAARDEALQKTEALTRKLAAGGTRKRTRISGASRNRKPSGASAPESAAVTPEPAPEPDAEEAVDIDAEARILQLIAEGKIDPEGAVLELVGNGVSASKAGVLVGKSDSYGRQVVRTAKKLTEAAPKGPDADHPALNGQNPEGGDS